MTCTEEQIKLADERLKSADAIDLLALHTALVGAHEDGLQAGLCVVVGQYVPGGLDDFDTDIWVDRMLKPLIVLWPKHSGSYHYPVPDPDGRRTGEEIYCSWEGSQNMWHGPYGALRRELQQFCLALVEGIMDKRGIDRG